MKKGYACKYIDLLISLIFVVFLIVSCSANEKQDVEESAIMDFSTKQRFQERIKSFEKDPNIDDCVALMNDYLYLKEYDKAIAYGQSCINIGVEKESPGFIVHLWMAAAYRKKDNFLDAKHHLQRALQLDKKNIIIDNNNIEVYELQDVYQSLVGDK
jgi:tetratricopeptide (TPR) repeat protein